MANEGRHAKPKNDVFSRPARQPSREEYIAQPTRQPAGYTEYQPRREASATRYTERPAPRQQDPYARRSADPYTERPAQRRTDSYTERPAQRSAPRYAQRPVQSPTAYTDYEPDDLYVPRTPAEPPVRQSTPRTRPASQPTPYTQRVEARRSASVSREETTSTRSASRPAARPPRRSEGPAQPVPPRTTRPGAGADRPAVRRSSYKPRKRIDGGLVLAVVLLLALILFVLAKLFGNVGDKPQTGPDTPTVQTTPAPTAEATPVPTEAPTATPVPTPEGDPAKIVDGRIVPADWGVIVPEREEAQFNSFFDNSVMIGNSLAEGFYMWAGLAENFTFICNANLWIDQVIGGIDLSKITMNPGMYESIYLVFGLNEVGNSVELFIQEYDELVDFLREYQPNATIYIHSVTPIMQKVDEDPGEVQTMERIDNFNARLKEFCAEKGCWYMDIYSMLLDEDGYLSIEYAFEGDGKHFEKSGYVAWANYLKTHYVDESLVSE